jgi:hypothetical protein
MFKVIIAGGREFSNYSLLEKSLTAILSQKKDIEIVSGHASGADSLGERFAQENNHPVKLFPADWNKYGKSAGPRRNAEMAKYADALVAFWDGQSRGTSNMIECAKKEDILIRVVKY